MAEPVFCPNREWLGLPPTEGPPTLYQLLALPAQEADSSKITAALEKTIAKVRAIRPGAHAEQWAELLDRLFEAREILLNPARKAEYDAGLPKPSHAPTATTEPAGANSSRLPTPPLKETDHPKFPPGMGPNSAAPAPASMALTAPPLSSATGPRSSAESEMLSNSAADMLPPGPSKPLAPKTAPEQRASDQRAPEQHRLEPQAAPGASPPAAEAAPAQPQPAFGQPVPQAYPVAYPAAFPGAMAAGYGPQLGYPAAYPQPGYPSAHPGYPSAQPGYPPAQAYPSAQAHPQPQPFPQPSGWPPNTYYGMPGQPPAALPAYPQVPGYGPSYPGAMAPGAATGYGMPPGYGQPAYPQPGPGYADTGSAYALADQAVAGLSLGPMARVAIPPAVLGAQPPTDAAGHRIVGFAAAEAARAAREIPTGKAVAPAQSQPTAPPPATRFRGSPKGEATAEGHPRREASPAAARSPALGSAAEDKPAPRGEVHYPPPEENNSMLYWGVGGALVLLVAAVVYAVTAPRGEETVVATGPQPGLPPVAPAPPLSPPPSVAPKSPAGKPVSPPSGIKPAVPPVAPGAPGTPPSPGGNKPAPAEPGMSEPPQSGRTPSDNLPQPSTTTPAPSVPLPTSPAPPPMPTPAPPTPAPTPPPPATPVPTPTPAPTPPPPPAAKAPTAEELTQLNAALKRARVAMGEYNFEEADQELAKARKLATLPELQATVERLTMLGGYAKQFFGFLQQSLTDPTLTAGAELVVGKTRVVVVEASAKNIVLRVLGMNRSYGLDSMPKGIALALAERKMDNNDPVGRIVKGAFYALAKGGSQDDLDEAKTYWEQAQLAGADLGDLMQTLTDLKGEFALPPPK